MGFEEEFWLFRGLCLGFVGLGRVGFDVAGVLRRGLIMISHHPFGSMGRTESSGVKRV